MTAEESTRVSDATWALLTAAVVGFEVYTIRSGKLDWTLTRTIRRTFRTHHPNGKTVFLLGWGYFAVWMARHIAEADDPIDAVLNALGGNSE